MTYTQKRALGDIEHLRKLIGEDCPIEDVLPLCAVALAAVPVQAAAITQLRTALEQIIQATNAGDIRSIEGQEAWDRLNPFRRIARQALNKPKNPPTSESGVSLGPDGRR